MCAESRTGGLLTEHKVLLRALQQKSCSGVLYLWTVFFCHVYFDIYRTLYRHVGRIAEDCCETKQSLLDDYWPIESNHVELTGQAPRHKAEADVFTAMKDRSYFLNL